MARLPRLMGRGRALEVLLGADDVGGELAELYGYVNRSLPDSELDDFVDRLARRIARSAAQQRIRKLMDRGFHKPGDVENRLGYYVGQLGGRD